MVIYKNGYKIESIVYILLNYLSVCPYPQVVSSNSSSLQIALLVKNTNTGSEKECFGYKGEWV